MQTKSCHVMIITSLSLCTLASVSQCDLDAMLQRGLHLCCAAASLCLLVSTLLHDLLQPLFRRVICLSPP